MLSIRSFRPTRCAALVAVGLLSFGALAACGSSSSPAASTSTPAHAGSTTSPTAAPLPYVPIHEVFSAPGRCREDGSTLEMMDCFLHQVVTADTTVDTLQKQRFDQAPASTRVTLLGDDATWLKGRQTTCSRNLTGGTIDRVTTAQCLLRVSQARIKQLQAAA
jgi:uncharacterized protein YecT (DUF1311 family)